MAWVFATHYGTNDTIGHSGFRKAYRGLVQNEGNGCCKHLDVADFFGSRMKEHVAVLRGWTTSAPGLEEVLHMNADFPFHAANGLLQHSGKDWVRGTDLHGILKTLVTPSP